MTEIVPGRGAWSAADTTGAVRKRLGRRYRADRRLQIYGLLAIAFAIGMLGILLTSIVVTGSPGFRQSQMTIPVSLSAEEIDAADPARADFRSITRDAFFALFPEVSDSRPQRRELQALLSDGAWVDVRSSVVSDPSLIGRTVRFSLPFSDPVDQLFKGTIDRDTPEEFRRISDQQIAWVDRMQADGLVSMPFNWGLFTHADSRFPELAGLKGGLIGSLYVVGICFLLSFPIGIAAAIYLEEFAPKNRFTDLIEVNINNLAAVPSIVYGLLGLAVFINFLGMPRSAPLVGGIVIALMTLPVIIIAARAALKAVPPSIREAALGVGASRMQTVLHHVLPVAMPGILTGTIIGMAAALGETAPLLLIGMNAFITAAPESILSASTTLPTQIYIWADSPERGFVARTSAGIMVLMIFMILMNGLAIFLRKRFEKRW